MGATQSQEQLAVTLENLSQDLTIAGCLFIILSCIILPGVRACVTHLDRLANADSCELLTAPDLPVQVRYEQPPRYEVWLMQGSDHQARHDARHREYHETSAFQL
jgi:hypothetical protein